MPTLASDPSPPRVPANALLSSNPISLSSSKRRVLLVDDHPVTRRGVRQLINQQLNIAVCGETDSAEGALNLIGKLQPDAAIVDISLPAANGIELLRALRRLAPDLIVLVLSMHDEELYAEEAMRAGASGFLMKDQAAEEIVVALAQVLRGDTYFSPRIKQRMLHLLSHNRRRNSNFAIDTLSHREREVLELMGDGYTPAEIATRFGLSRKTIDSYREHLRRKLGMGESSGLVRYAIQWRRAVQDVAAVSLPASGARLRNCHEVRLARDPPSLARRRKNHHASIAALTIEKEE